MLSMGCWGHESPTQLLNFRRAMLQRCRRLRVARILKGLNWFLWLWGWIGGRCTAFASFWINFAIICATCSVLMFACGKNGTFMLGWRFGLRRFGPDPAWREYGRCEDAVYWYAEGLEMPEAGGCSTTGEEIWWTAKAMHGRFDIRILISNIGHSRLKVFDSFIASWELLLALVNKFTFTCFMYWIKWRK